MSDEAKVGAEDNTAVDAAPEKGSSSSDASPRSGEGEGLENVFPDDKVKKARVSAGNKPGEVTDAERVADPTILGVAAGRATPPTQDERLAADPALEPQAAWERDNAGADMVQAAAEKAGVDVHRAIGHESESGKKKRK